MLALLVAAARPLAIESVAELLGEPMSEVVDVVSGLAGSGIVVDDAGVVRISHDVVRQTLAHLMPPERIRRMHLRLSDWLIEGPDDAHRLLEALHHLAEASSPMLPVAVRLAASDERRLIGSAGLATLAAVADGERGPDADRLNQLIAALAMDLGEHEEALRRWSSGLDRSDGEAAAVCALGAARAALELGRIDEASSLVQRAREAVAEPDLRLTVEIEAIDSAMIRWLEHRSEEAADAAARAVQGARALAEAAGGVDRLAPDARRAYLQALRSASDAALHADDPPRMLALADETARVAAGHDDRTHLQALTRRGLALRFLGRNADAEATLRRAWDTARARALPQAILEVGGLRGTVLVSLGRLAEAAEVARECLQVGQRLQEFGPIASVQPHRPRAARGARRRLASRDRDARRRGKRGSRTALPASHASRASGRPRAACTAAARRDRRCHSPGDRGRRAGGLPALHVGDIGPRRGSTGPERRARRRQTSHGGLARGGR